MGSHSYDVAHLITLARRARERARLDAVFASVAQGDAAERALADATEAGFAVLDRPLLANPNPGIRSPLRRARTTRDANLRIVEEVLASLRPAGVVSTVNPPPSLFLDPAAARGVPTVLLQLWFWGDRDFQRAWRADDRRVQEASQPWPVRVRRAIDRRCEAHYGMPPHIVWNVKRTTVAVHGPAMRHQLVADGVPESNVVVTGNPVLDEIHGLQADPESARGRVASRLGIPRNVPIVAHMRSHEDRMLTVDRADREASQRQIIGALRAAAPHARIVVKTHPREGAEVTAAVRALDPGVTVTGPEVETLDLLASAALVVGTFSTTLLQSVALDRPTVSAVLWPGLDYWRRATHWSGVDRVESAPALTEAVRRHLNDPEYGAAWSARRARFREQHFLVDGMGTDRLVDLIVQRTDR